MYQQLLRKWVVPVLALIVLTMAFRFMTPERSQAVTPDYSGLPTAKPSDPGLYVSQLPVDELLRAPESVVVDGTVVKLRTHLYRDLTPYLLPEGSKRKKRRRPMVGTLTLYTVDGPPPDEGLPFPREFPFPPDIVVDEACLLLDGRVWATSVPMCRANGPNVYAPGSRRAPFRRGRVDKQLTVRITNGPEWRTGVDVDVVVRIVDANGNVLLLRAGNQRIIIVC